MFRDEPYQDAFKAAAESTRARIRRDRARAPKVLKKVFTVLAGRLFHPSLNATRAWRDAGVRDRALGTVFRAFTGTSLKCYIEARRIEVAGVLMAITDLDLFSISEKIGYTHYPTFTDAYQRQKDKLPSAVTREHLTPALIDDATSLKAGRGLLDDEDAVVRHMEDLLRIYPAVTGRVQIGVCPDPEPQIIVDGARDDRLKAEDLWRKIRDLPYAEQCQKVRRYRFFSTVFFDLLREKSRWQGHTDHQRGIDLAKLALISLENSDRVFGRRIHDLRALGWAWLANALRLALDFTAAAAAFEQADREWSEPREQPDLVVLAHIYRLKGVLWMMRREYVAATRELDRSCALFRQSNQTSDEVRSLIYRALIHMYADNLGEAVEDLREAAGLVDEEQEKQLAFAIRGNLANTMARAGETQSAAKELDRARQLNSAVDDPMGTIKLDWIEGDLGELQGDLERAQRFYQIVRTRFHDADEPRYLGMVTVDLMSIHSQQGDWERVRELAVVTLPLLTSIQLHSETAAAVGLLAEAVEAQSLSRGLLIDLRVALRQDPLAM